jgi:hypothetical protein
MKTLRLNFTAIIMIVMMLVIDFFSFPYLIGIVKTITINNATWKSFIAVVLLTAVINCNFGLIFRLKEKTTDVIFRLVCSFLFEVIVSVIGLPLIGTIYGIIILYLFFWGIATFAILLDEVLENNIRA